jgi:hypothetical protein
MRMANGKDWRGGAVRIAIIMARGCTRWVGVVEEDGCLWESSMTWMHKLRLRVLTVAVALALFALGAISLTAIPAWPVVGVAVACFAMAVNSMASRLGQATCFGCGHDISGEAAGPHGVPCTECGSLNFMPESGQAKLASGVDAQRRKTS